MARARDRLGIGSELARDQTMMKGLLSSGLARDRCLGIGIGLGSKF